MKINHNIPALRTLNELNKVNNKAADSMLRLSSGLRINSAADDAAGLAIANKMDAPIRGLRQANRNTMDGISLVQTAEGALNEVHAILQRMRELSVQAANGTYSEDDLEKIQLEVDELTEEINRIGDATEFNTKPLLKGKDEETNLFINDLTVEAGGTGTWTHNFLVIFSSDIFSNLLIVSFSLILQFSGYFIMTIYLFHLQFYATYSILYIIKGFIRSFS